MPLLLLLNGPSCRVRPDGGPALSPSLSTRPHWTIGIRDPESGYIQAVTGNKGMYPYWNITLHEALSDGMKGL